MIHTRFQKTCFAIFCLVLAAVLAFSCVVKESYNRISLNPSSYDNARILIDDDTANANDETYENLTFDILNDDLQNADTIFVGTVKEMKNQYECLKYTINVNKVIRSNDLKKNETVIFYYTGQFEYFKEDAFKGKLAEKGMVINGSNLKGLYYFGNIPLKIGKSYLIFAERMRYYKDYQDTLKYKEYCEFFDTRYPMVFCLDEYQKKPADQNEKYFKDMKNNEFSVYSEKGLENMNKVKKQIINYYCK